MSANRFRGSIGRQESHETHPLPRLRQPAEVGFVTPLSRNGADLGPILSENAYGMGTFLLPVREGCRKALKQITESSCLC